MFSNLTALFSKDARIFYLISLLFPREYQSDVYVLYHFVHKTYILAHSNPPQQKLFRTFVREYQNALENKRTQSAMLSSFAQLVNSKKISSHTVDTYLIAIESELKSARFTDADSLKQHFDELAGAVAQMLGSITESEPEEIDIMSQVFAATYYPFLLRRFGQDETADRIFIPTQEYKAKGFSSLEIETTLHDSKQFVELVEDQLTSYNKWRNAAKQKLVELPYESRVLCYSLIELADWIAAQIRAEPFRVYDPQPVSPSSRQMYVSLLKNRLQRLV